MAHLWVRKDYEEWAVLPLEADAYSLAANTPLALDGRAPAADGSDVLLVRERSAGSVSWVLISSAAAAAVRINGLPLVLGVRAVADRDEISVGEAGPFYFSAESLARVEAFQGSGQTLYCPRCKLGVEEQTPAVKCPQCGVWYHQSDELPCWAYAETCALCPQPTAAEAGFRWTPEEL